MNKLMHEVRGLRNNNPGNIRVGQQFQGETKGLVGVPPEDSFSQFVCMDMGLRALFRVLKTYREVYSIVNISGIIKRWAPPCENDTEAYIKSALSYFVGIDGFDEHTALKLDGEDYPLLCMAIISHENGFCPFTKNYIVKVYKWAVPEWN